jgi:hypothetical protein
MFKLMQPDAMLLTVQLSNDTDRHRNSLRRRLVCDVAINGFVENVWATRW